MYCNLIVTSDKREIICTCKYFVNETSADNARKKDSWRLKITAVIDNRIKQNNVDAIVFWK